VEYESELNQFAKILVVSRCLYVLTDAEVARSLTPWPSAASTRKAVVNSFGFGGTNAMVVLESRHVQSGKCVCLCLLSR
jgi:hypothetical protein